MIYMDKFEQLQKRINEKLESDSDNQLLKELSLETREIALNNEQQSKEPQGNEDQNQKITIDDVRKMSNEDINKNWDDVNDLMNGSNK